MSGVKQIKTLPYGLFNIVVVSADGLEEVGDHKPDAFVRIKYPTKKPVSFRTESFENYIRPKWYEEFQIYMDDLSIPIEIYLRDSSVVDGNRRQLGHLKIDVNSIPVNKRQEVELKLEGGTATIKLIYALTPLTSLPHEYEKLTRKNPSFRLIVNSTRGIKCQDYLEGKIVYMSPRPRKVEKLFIRLYGTEQVLWTEAEKSLVPTTLEFTGDTTIVNKWYHGWANDKKDNTLDAGFYVWTVRIRIPDDLPPTFKDSVGQIRYWLYAYLDHGDHTSGTPISIIKPIVQKSAPEATISGHKLTVAGFLSQPVFYLEDSPITIGLDLTVTNLSDYYVHGIKIQILERATYSASDNVYTSFRRLFKGIYAKHRITGHSSWHDFIHIDLPVGYRKPSLIKAFGATRIHVDHVIRISVKKDTLNMAKVVAEIPFIVTTKDYEITEKRQVISLVKESNVITPPTPVTNRRSLKGKKGKGKGDQKIASIPEDSAAAPSTPTEVEPSATAPGFVFSPSPQYKMYQEDMLFPNTFNPFHEHQDPFHHQAKPIPSNIIDFNSPAPSVSPSGNQEITWTPQPATYNPFVAVTNPFLPRSPGTAYANNPFLSNPKASQIPKPAAPTPTSQGAQPSVKNPFLA